jgi:hypothetical protein
MGAQTATCREDAKPLQPRVERYLGAASVSDEREADVPAVGIGKLVVGRASEVEPLEPAAGLDTNLLSTS